MTQDHAAGVLQGIFDVQGARVLVTGAASGLGFAFAEALADCGAHVTLADIDAGTLEASTKTLADRGLHVRSAVVDVNDAAAVQSAIDALVEAEGGLDVVFANAGIGAVPGYAFEGGQTLDGIDPADLNRVLGVNLHGMLHTIGSAAGVMKRQGSGRIIVTSSIAGVQPEPFVCYGYISSKAAIINIVRHAALELAPYGITVNAIAPGPVKGTRIGGGATLDPDADAEAGWAKMIPAGRMGNPDELKGLALLLGSPASSFLTGQTVVIDGGATLAGPGVQS
jgi:NAD(P)-dependent dehydrogenase (short-subunit alcohol dehydrogenase family)